MKPHGSMKEYLEFAAQQRPRVQPCLDEDRLIEYYLGRLDESETGTIQDHLVDCADCLELAQDVQKFLAAMPQPVNSVEVPEVSALIPHALQGRTLLLLAASLIIAVGIGYWLWRGSRVQSPPGQLTQTPHATPSGTTQENPWRDLQIAKAQYTPAPTSPDDLIWRDDSPLSGEQRKRGPFAQAMQAYESNDFARAERQLGQFLEKDPKHAAALFYRGVSLLLLGKTADAVAPLEAAATLGQGRLRDEAHWYLAQTYLKTGDYSKALEQLDVVIQTSSKHRADAEQPRALVKQILDHRSKQ